MKTRYILVLGLIIVAVSIGLWVWSCRVQDEKLAKNLQSISVGMPKQEVLTMLGKPLGDDPCGTNFGPRSNLNCKRELMYGSALGGLLPSYTLILLDANDKVLEKVELQSP